jgi:hypothetical protein
VMVDYSPLSSVEVNTGDAILQVGLNIPQTRLLSCAEISTELIGSCTIPLKIYISYSNGIIFRIHHIKIYY